MTLVVCRSRPISCYRCEAYCVPGIKLTPSKRKPGESMRVTKRSVEAAKPVDKRYFLWDDELKGFGCCIHPSGRRVYVVRYISREGRDRRMVLGAHGPLTPQQVRLLAVETLGKTRQPNARNAAATTRSLTSRRGTSASTRSRRSPRARTSASCASTFCRRLAATRSATCRSTTSRGCMPR